MGRDDDELNELIGTDSEEDESQEGKEDHEGPLAEPSEFDPMR